MANNIENSKTGSAISKSNEEIKSAFVKIATAPIPTQVGKEVLAKELTLRAQTLEDLLKKGAFVNERLDADNNTALMYASAQGNTPVFNLLLKYHADVNAADQYGQTALMLASQAGYVEIVQALLQANADVNAVDRFGRTALLWASQEGHSEVVKALLKAGANINAKFRSWTALMVAGKAGHTETVRVLLKAGADVNAKDSDGKTALQYAVQEKRAEIADLLKSAGATE